MTRQFYPVAPALYRQLLAAKPIYLFLNRLLASQSVREQRVRTEADRVLMIARELEELLVREDDFKRCQATQSLATVSGHVFVESVTGLDARIMGLTSDFTQQGKFTLWEQSSSDVCHKSDTV